MSIIIKSVVVLVARYNVIFVVTEGHAVLHVIPDPHPVFSILSFTIQKCLFVAGQMG